MAPSLTDDTGESEGGAPTVLLEMQAAGMPVISTLHADIPEVVIDGRSGFLVAERDSNALAEKLLFLVEHPEIWEFMGKAGRKNIEEDYNIRLEAPKLERVYEQLVG
jgi:colanic acid/amylovoran biosynthesis glycosyltransferase